MRAQSAGFTSQNELIGKADSDQSLPWHVYHHTIQENDRLVMQTQELQTIEEVATMKGDHEKIFLSKKLPTYDKNGEVDGIVGVSVDITKEKEVERQVQETFQQQLYSANLVTAAIAHELRTPLMTINNTITALKMRLPSQEPLLIDRIQTIKNEINKANECINMLLMNIKEIKLEQLSLCTIKACIAEAITRYPYSNAKDRDLIDFNASEEDFSFLGEKTLMVHVLFNLIKNAIYFIYKADKGKMTISTQVDELYNYLFFEDTACGINEVDLSKIFDRFYTTTDIGSGVGLSFCQLTIEKFGGSIHCDSVEGKFTKFTIKLPKVPI